MGRLNRRKYYRRHSRFSRYRINRIGKKDFHNRKSSLLYFYSFSFGQQVLTTSYVYKEAADIVEHFVFRSPKCTAYRTEMLQCTNTFRSNTSFNLRRKLPSFSNKWTPDIRVVRAIIPFAMPKWNFALGDLFDLHLGSIVVLQVYAL